MTRNETADLQLLLELSMNMGVPRGTRDGAAATVMERVQGWDGNIQMLGQRCWEQLKWIAEVCEYNEPVRRAA